MKIVILNHLSTQIHRKNNIDSFKNDKNPLNKMESTENQSDLIKITDNYYLIEAIGGGTCGDVIKGKDINTGEIVAMKKIKYLHIEQGFPINAMREIKFLREIKSHENIITLKSVETSAERYVYLIFDYCEYDLQGILSLTSLTFSQIKCYMRQLLIALDVCNKNKLIHRDLKPANILLTPQNVVKLCDFGLAKDYKEILSKPPTNKVITIWYRPPELLLGTDHYGAEIDIWSAGCILYEMITREVLFRSNYDNENDEISAIFRVHGVPTDAEWPGWKDLPNAKLFLDNRIAPPHRQSFQEFLEKKIPAEFHDAIDLMMKMLQLDPTKRISVEEALKHPFINDNYEDYHHSKLPELTLTSCHQSQITTTQTKKPRKKCDVSKLRPSKPKLPDVH
ncbi:CMGC family protein kinase [Tritrichomonas foetus]|uniref:CMGC family protein kinase n=1 Tax=Tritrichomonas foetus TaxID=1144522 RepID=A0A1J4JG90_9EUKA|nr:CMGC family protein kinase [Tritrichomonas foetus]|eukprot:OHS97319.1 CMGC family protein kinase [Tritrichomonas foetus]